MTSNQRDTQLQKTLDACLEFANRRGLKGLSLRSLAQGANMSARMLVHYFGSAENLFGKIMTRFVEQEKLRADNIAQIAMASVKPLQTFIETYINQAKEKTLANNIFEIYGAAIIGNKNAADLLKELLEHWVKSVQSISENISNVEAGIVFSFANGAVLDLLATKDDERIKKSIIEFCRKLNIN